MTVQAHLSFGLGLRARHPSILQDHARSAEAAGFDHVWVYDSPRFAEPYVAMAYCAMAAPRVVVGTAVTNAVTRDPTVIANGFATLSLLTGGRVKLGIGLGDSAVKFIGQKPATFEEFREKIAVIRALLAGEKIDCNGRTLQLPVRPTPPPPILIAAEGPRTFEFAATACDGAIISPGGSPRFLAHAIGHMRRAAARAGRDPAALHVCAWTHCVVAEDRQRAIEELRPQVSRTLFKGAIRVPPEVFGRREPLVSDELRQRALDHVARQDKEYALADELAAVLGDDLLRELTVVGTPDDVGAKVAALAAVDGVSQIIINVHGTDPALTYAVFRDRIIPRHR